MVEELVDGPLAVEGSQDLADGRVLLQLGAVGRARRGEHVLLAGDGPADLFELGRALDGLVRERDGRERDPGLEVLALEDVQGRLAANQLALEALEGEELEDLLGDLISQGLVDVALLDDPHSDQDLAQAEAVVGRALALEGRVELGRRQLVPLEERLPDQGPGARRLEELHDPALDVDVLDATVTAGQAEGPRLLLLFEVGQEVAELLLGPGPSIDDQGHRSSPGPGGLSGTSSGGGRSPSGASRGGSPRASRILLIMAR